MPAPAIPSDDLPPGKLPVALLAELLGGLPPLPADVLVGPAPGEDACALAVGGAVLVAATDPITLTGAEAGRLAVLVNANDVAVMGAAPRWFLAAILLPTGSTAGDVHALFASVTGALAEVGAALVGGHTEVTPAVRHAVVVGQMLGTAAGGRVVTTGGARPGDVLVQVGAVPVEGAAVLAAEAGDRLATLDPDVRRAAAAAVDDPGISVVDPALAAAHLGATAMHDPTEGGLAAALDELARASATSVRVDSKAVAWFDPGVAVCRALGADPWATLASGCLLATFPADDAAAAVATLGAGGRPAAVIGGIHAGPAGVWVDGAPLDAPARDEVARVLHH
jgi:hydrogenase expression/formation protein HypE